MRESRKLNWSLSFKVWGGCRVYLLYLLSLVSVRCHQCNPRCFCASYLERLILILFMKLTVNSVVAVRSGLSSRGCSLNAVLPTGIYACARAFDTKSCSKCSVWCLTRFTHLSKQFYVLDYTWVFTWISRSILITEQRLILFLKGVWKIYSQERSLCTILPISLGHSWVERFSVGHNFSDAYFD